MDYREALDYILKFADYERLPRSAFVFDLRRMEQLLERLGNPHQAVRSVHITGTKGKGSTSAMIASILTHSGYKTGLYTSPHLLSFTERIQVDGKPILENDLARLTEILKPEVEEVNRIGTYGQLTTFEIITALAFYYYKEIGCAYQVLEVGLGGRLDATNVIPKPDVSIITSVSFDHMDVLGHTLAQIATEKAGIIKAGGTVVSAPQFPEAMAVIETICRERSARLIRTDRDMAWHKKKSNAKGQSFTLKGLKRSYDLNIPLLGEYQVENAASAVATAEILTDLGAKISPETISDGLAGVHWPGRLQILQRRPLVVIDGAHNAYSIKRLGEALRQYFKFDNLRLIIGASSDKDIPGMVAELAILTKEVIVTSSRHPRSVAPERLVSEFARFGTTPQIAENVASAVEKALAEASPADLICATGSIFLIAEVMEHLHVKA
ncbi:MAG: folylpolyglutamate synthase/dihydrofolate synthase family protein [Dehalococcoidales bacterium]|nr:folylpolyglutamate synthase/dihydrofolate synthase family protein [Dehalococcoidales bacterium]